MNKSFFLLAFLLLAVRGYSQEERVYLQLDKYACSAGDTVWFKGVVVSGNQPSRISTNLYVELYSERGNLLDREDFAVVRGASIGQMKIPDAVLSGTYFLRAFTRLQLNFDIAGLFSVPLRTRNPDDPKKVSLKREIVNPKTLTAGRINSVYWTTSIYKGQLSSLLAVDSGQQGTRDFHLIKQVTGASVLNSDISLGGTTDEQYVLFPVDTAKESESLFLLEDSTLIGRQSLPIRNDPDVLTVSADTLDNGPSGYNSWEITLPDTSRSSLCIAVADADVASATPTSIMRLKAPFTDNLSIPVREADSSYISFTGKATKASGKGIKDDFSKELLFAGVKDSSFLFTKVAKIDSAGNFRLDSLVFFGNIDLQFQINKAEDGSTKNVRLSLQEFTPPEADSADFAAAWEDDGLPVATIDTVDRRAETLASSRAKTLKPVTVNGWRNKRPELDDRYTTGPFSEPALYYYDLRTYYGNVDRDIFWYLNAQGGRLIYDPAGDSLEDVFGHPIHFFVDQIEYEPKSIRMFDFDRLAYIKVLESDFLSTRRITFSLEGQTTKKPLGTPVEKEAINVCIYTRKGADFRTMLGGLNKISVKGYSDILQFHPDSTTLYWNPQAIGNGFRIRFTNNEHTRRFRLVIEGYNNAGKLLHLEEVLPK
jgi:hypothetical protein